MDSNWEGAPRELAMYIAKVTNYIGLSAALYHMRYSYEANGGGRRGQLQESIHARTLVRSKEPLGTQISPSIAS